MEVDQAFIWNEEQEVILLFKIIVLHHQTGNDNNHTYGFMQIRRDCYKLRRTFTNAFKHCTVI
jgi:hypothetical protein